MNLFKIVAIAGLPLTLGLVPQAASAQTPMAPKAVVEAPAQSPHAHQFRRALRLSEEQKEILAASYMAHFWNRQAASDDQAR